MLLIQTLTMMLDTESELLRRTHYCGADLTNSGIVMTSCEEAPTQASLCYSSVTLHSSTFLLPDFRRESGRRFADLADERSQPVAVSLLAITSP